MKHEQVLDLLEEYSLGLLDEKQFDAVDEHLDLCEACRDRLLRLSELAEAMAESVPQHDPPANIEEELMNQVESSPVKPQQVAMGSRLGWIVAAAAALGALYFGVQNTELGTELGKTQAQVDSLSTYVEKLRNDMAAYEDATQLLGKPGMQFVDMAGVGPNGQAFGKVVVDPEGNTGVVYMYQLPDTPEGMEYQLWVMHEGKPTSAGTFTVANDGSAMLSLEALPDFSQIAAFEVTIEPVGGQTEPTGMMYLTGPNTLQFHR